jgi:hypothetical protein
MSRTHLGLLSIALPLAACASSSREGFEDPTPAAPAPAPPPTGDFGPSTPPPAPANGPEIHEVFGHSASTLFKLDPDTKTVTVIGDFTGCSSVTDIALDETSTLYATTAKALYKVDTATARCTQIGTGSYPNSLSFVPKGTVDAAVEALVGYEEGDYLRIDTTTGGTTKIGALGRGMRSSGDIVSVKGGATYLTVKSSSCNDCLVEVNPRTGAVVRDWGTVSHDDVFGLAFWGGKVYGFAKGGDLFEVTFTGSSIKTKAISIPSAPAGLSFWGAGSTTSAPLVETPE